MSDAIEFTLSGTAEGAIQLDLVADEVGIEILEKVERTHGTGYRVYYAMPRGSVEKVLQLLEERGAPEWDQPAHWGAACRREAVKLRALLKEG